VSADTQQLERSALERKDRDELHTIATALGGKPGSRAKKADMVDLILELAGVTPASGSVSPDSSSSPDSSGASGSSGDSPAIEPRARRSRGRAAAEVPPSSSDTDTDVAGAVGDTETASEASRGGFVTDRSRNGRDGRNPAPRERNESGDRNSAGRSNQNQAGSGDRLPRTERNDRTDRGATDRTDRGATDRTDRADRGVTDPTNQVSPTGSSSQGGPGDPNQVPPVDRDGQGDGDAGNRRRRRRGRDRERGDRPETDQPFQGEPVEVAGLLDLRDEGYGFLRLKGYLPSKDDVYISVKQARQFALRKGDHLTGTARPAARNEKNPAMLHIDTVGGLDPEQAKARPRFDDLIPQFPDERLRLEVTSEPTNLTARIIDLVAPIGKGQRGLIVSPPNAGKTTVLKQIIRSIESNNPEVHLIVLLVDERPEEVTDMRRWVQNGEVAASTFDRPSDEHTMMAELTIERAKRMVEDGRDVLIILDGLTRLVRAYNLAATAGGRIVAGGVDSSALYPPKKFFGAAANIEDGGSLTILATALVETGSATDDVILDELGGTANMVLRLDGVLAAQRIYPAVDLAASSTRHDELLVDAKQLPALATLREGDGIEQLIGRLGSFKTNDLFLADRAKARSSR
jgi:transcription termination factor Rho